MVYPTQLELVAVLSSECLDRVPRAEYAVLGAQYLEYTETTYWEYNAHNARCTLSSQSACQFGVRQSLGSTFPECSMRSTRSALCIRSIQSTRSMYSEYSECLEYSEYSEHLGYDCNKEIASNFTRWVVVAHLFDEQQ